VFCTNLDFRRQTDGKKLSIKFVIRIKLQNGQENLQKNA
jgi:hypothetical protein